MPSLKEIKNRVDSVNSTLKITSAMKMVAAAKLHKAQTAIGNMLPYEDMLHRMLANLIAYKRRAEKKEDLDKLTTIEQITGGNFFFLVGKNRVIRLRRRREMPHVTSFSIISIHILSLTIAVTNIFCFPRRLRSCSMLL